MKFPEFSELRKDATGKYHIATDDFDRTRAVGETDRAYEKRIEKIKWAEFNQRANKNDENYQSASQMALNLAKSNGKTTASEPLVKKYTDSPSTNFATNMAANWLPRMQKNVTQGRKAVSQEDSYTHATDVLSSLDEKQRKILDDYVKASDQATSFNIANSMGMGGGAFGFTNSVKPSSEKQRLKKEFMDATGVSEEEFAKYAENASWLSHYNSNEKNKEAMKDDSAASLATASAFDVLMSPMSNLMGLSTAKNSSDEKLGRDYNNLYATGRNFSQNVEETVNNAITEANGGKESWKNDAYNIGMSIGKSAVNMAIGGAAGAGSGLGEVGARVVANLTSLPSFGAEAYVSSYKEAADRGATDKQATVTGIVAGLAEMGTEIFSLDAAWDIIKDGGTKLGKNLIANLIAQSLIEGSEEGASDIINELSDIIVNQDVSRYAKEKEYYLSLGKSEEEASSLAQKSFFSQLLNDIKAGTISGFVFGGGATGINTAVTTHYGRNIGLGKYGDILEEPNPSYVSQNRQDYSSDEAYTTAQKASLDFKKAQYAAAEGKRISGKAARELYKGVSESVMDQASVRESNLVTKISEATDVKELTKAYESAPTDEEGNVSKAVQEAFDLRAERFDANDLESVVTPKKAAELAYKGKEFTDSQKAYIENNQDEKEAIESAYKNGANRRIIENNDNAFIDSSTGYAHILDMDKGITKEGDSYVVADNEGNTYDVAEIQTTKRLKDAITYSSGFIDETVANASLEVFKNNPESTPTVVKTAISWARQAAAFGNVSFSQFAEGKKGKAINSMMDINTLKDIYELEYNKALESQKKKKSDKVFKSKEAGLYYDKSIAKAVEEKYSQAERTLVDMMARATGQRYVITDEKSAVGDRANFTANIATAVFRLDENPSLWQTVNHEGLGEVLEAFNNEDMKEIQDVIISYLIDSYGGEDKLFTHLFTTYGGNYKGKTVRELADEMVNDTIAGITSKGEEFDKLIKWLESNKTVEEQKSFREKFKEMLSKIWTYIKGVVSKNELDDEAMRAYKMSEKEASRVMDMILNALDKVNESENIQVVEMAGYEYDQETSTVYSLKYSTSQENMSEVDRDSLIKSISQLTGRTEAEAERYLADEAVAEIVKGTFLDFEGNEKEIAIKNNSDYPQGTIDLTNICPKRVPVTKLTNRLQEALPNDLFTADDYADIRLILMDDGRIVACGLCYVEDRRQYLGEIAQDFINEWNKALTNKTNLKRINSSKEIKDVSIGEDVAKRYGVSSGLVTPYKMKFKQETFAVSDNWFKLQKEHPDIAAAFEAFNNARGQSAGRLLLDRAEYKREILKWSPDKVKEVNDVGGLRIFSFSDFEVVHLIDLLQIIEDCAVMGVKIQGYTKQTKFAKLVSKTGIKLNRSFIPYGATGLKKVNGKTVLAIDTIEGINNEDEYFLDESDNPNVGNNITGINDEQIHVAMKDNFFHYIIPFHTNKKAETNAKLGVAMWRNYKLYQTDKTSKSAEDIQKVFKEVYKNKASGMSDTDAYDKALKDLNIKFAALKEDKMVNIYTEVLPDESVVDEKTFLIKYLDVCKERNIVPRYPQFLNVDEEGNFLYTEGYTKFLVDFKLFNYETGEILPQENVVPVFNDEFIASIVNEELSKTEEERYKDEYPEDLYKDILNYIKVKHGYKGNTKSYEKYKKIVSDQVERSNRDDDGTRGMSVSPSTQYSIKKVSDMVDSFYLGTYFKNATIDDSIDFDFAELPLFYGNFKERENEIIKDDYLVGINNIVRINKKKDGFDAHEFISIDSVLDRVEKGELSNGRTKDELRKMFDAIRTEYDPIKQYNRYVNSKATDEGVWNIKQIRSNISKSKRRGCSELRRPSQKEVSRIEKLSDAEIFYEYDEAAKEKDLEKCQYLVNEMAIRNGYTNHLYHGTQSEFYEFKTNTEGVHLGKKGSAYTKAFASNGENLNNGRVIDAYVRFNTPIFVSFDLGEWSWYEVSNVILNNVDGNKTTVWYHNRSKTGHHFNEDAGDFEEKRIPVSIKLNNEQISEIRKLKATKSIDAEAGLKRLQGILKKSYYNAIEYPNHYEGIGEYSYIVFDSNQVKDSSPILYNKDGNIIPLSERFNENSDDIRYSIKKDSTGKELTNDQAEYFKDSKVLDLNGNLKVMYHGSPDSPFTIFNPSMSDDGISLFFTDDFNVATSYSGDDFEITKNSLPVNIRTFNQLKEYAGNEFTVDKTSKGYKVAMKGLSPTEFDTIDEAYRWMYWMNYGRDASTIKGGVYPVYLKSTNPLVIDAKGKKWNDITSGIKKLDGATTRQYAKYAKDNGYDALIVNNLVDIGTYGSMNRESQVVVVFNPNQVKSIYNEKPTKDDDIRYSIKPESEGGGNGYDGYSMSNNARYAYENGEKPLSKWTKANIIDAVREIDENKAEMLSKVNLKTLKDNILVNSSWHHTSEYYNKTDFYSVDEDKINNLTEKEIIHLSTQKETKALGREFRGDITYLEWSGTRNHPKATEVKLTDVNIEERGSFYYVTDDDGKLLVKKKIGSNGTSVVDYELEERVRQKTLEREAERNKLVKETSSAAAYAFFDDVQKNGMSRSASGNIYREGEKPNSYEFENKLIKVGTQRLVPVYDKYELSKYVLEEWNGKEWVSAEKNSKAYSIKQLGDSSPYAKAYQQIDVVTSIMDEVNENVVGTKKLKADQVRRLANGLIGRYNLTMDMAYIKELQSDIETFDEYMRSGQVDYNTMMDYLMQIADEVRVKAHYFSGGSDMDNDLIIATTLLSDYYKARDARNSEIKAAKKIAEKTEEYKAELKADYDEKVAEIESQLYVKNLSNAKVAAHGGNAPVYTNVDLHRMAEEMAYERLNDIQYAQENAKRRQRIVTTCTRLINWMDKPTNEKHVPEFLKPALADMIASIDFMPKSMQTFDYMQKDTKVALNWRKSMEKLQNVLNDVAKAEASSKDAQTRLKYNMSIVLEANDLIIDMQNLLDATEGQMTVSRLSNENLRKLSNIMDAMSSAINRLNELFKNSTFENVDKLGAASLKEMGSLKTLSNDINASKLFAHEFLDIDMLEPDTFFYEFGEASHTLMKEFFDGELEGIKVVREAENVFINLHKKLNVSNADTQGWSEDVHTFDVNGGKITLTTADIMYLYAADKREKMDQANRPDEATHHIAAGGIKGYKHKIKNRVINANPDILHATESDIKSIVSTLTDTQKAYVDSVVEYLSTTLGSHGNDISMQMYGYNKFEGKYYIPLKVDRDEIAKTESNAETSQQMMRGLINQSFTKSQIDRADNALVIHDFFDVVTEHINGMANYVAYAMPIADALRWYNYAETTREKIEGVENFDGTQAYERITNSMSQAMKKVKGDKATAYFETFLRDVNMNNKAEANALADKLIGSYKAQAVGANLRVVIQQPCAIFRAEDVIESKYLAKGVSIVMTNPKKYMEYAQDKNLLCYWKSKGFSDTRIAQNMKQVITGNVTKIDSLVEASGVLAGLADDITWASMYLACEEKAKAEGIDADELFSKVVNETQVIDSMLRQTQQMRKKDRLAKLANAFKKEPQKSYNMLHRKLYDYYQNPKSVNAKNALVKVLKVYVNTAIVTAIAQSIADACRDDSEDKWVEKFLRALLPVESVEAIKDAAENGLKWSTAKDIYAGSGNIVDNLNPLTLIPYLSDFDSFLKGFDSVRMDIAIFQQIAEISTVLDKETATSYQKLYKTLQLVSSATAVGMSNLLREFKVFNNNVLAPFTGKKIYTSTTYRDKALKDKEKARIESLYDSSDLTSIKEQMTNTYQSKIDEGKDESEAWSAVTTELHTQFDRQYELNPSVETVNRYVTLVMNTKHKSTKKADNGRYVNYTSDKARDKVNDWVNKLKE